MRRSLGAVLACALACGCSGEASPCATDADCMDGLTCIEERCRAVIDPLDGGADASSARMDAGTDGGGREDAGTAEDSGSGDDAGPVDAGEPTDAGPECTVGAGGCGPSRECRAADSLLACMGGAPGRCVDLPADDSIAPDCGCDGFSYRNARSRFEAGVEQAHEGFCTCGTCPAGAVCDRGSSCEGTPPEGVCVAQPATCADVAGETGFDCVGDSTTPRWTNECARLLDGAERVARVPTTCAPFPARAGCCFDDADCAGGVRSLCYQSTGCDAGEEGSCLPVPPPMECWGARDCPPGHECASPTISPCDAATSRTGRCVVRPEGLL